MYTFHVNTHAWLVWVVNPLRGVDGGWGGGGNLCFIFSNICHDCGILRNVKLTKGYLDNFWIATSLHFKVCEDVLPRQPWPVALTAGAVGAKIKFLRDTYWNTKATTVASNFGAKVRCFAERQWSHKRLTHLQFWHHKPLQLHIFHFCCQPPHPHTLFHACSHW